MNKIKTIIITAASAALFVGCSFLDTTPKDRVDEGTVFGSEEAVKAYRASLYQALPMEDHRYSFAQGFNILRPNNPIGATNMQLGLDAVNTSSSHTLADNIFNNWDYGIIRRYNGIKYDLEKMKAYGISDATLRQVEGEYHFFMAYAYFALARRYGGVLLVTDRYDEDEIMNGDPENLFIPRSTEMDTWKFVLSEFDKAAELLPETTSQVTATKWTALALKSRAALFAASELAYMNKGTNGYTPAPCDAVDQELVFTPEQAANKENAKFFYDECIKAAKEVIQSGHFSLAGAEPATVDEAADNYRKLFIEPTGFGKSECIFIRRYVDPSYPNNWGMYCQPFQIAVEYAARCCPTLDIVKSYQTIDENRHGGDYNTDFDNGLTDIDFRDLAAMKSSSGRLTELKRYENILDIYKGRDPRMYATVVLPGETFGEETMVIQAGIIDKDGQPYFFRGDYKQPAYEFEGKKYNVYGFEGQDRDNANPKGCSGYLGDNNHTLSGFLLKKGVRPGAYKAYDHGTDSFIEIRYAEVLMNFAEAVANGGDESLGEGVTAKDCLNKVRKRAGFLDEKEATPEIVRAERRSEFALEPYQAAWDPIRLREAHLMFNGNNRRMGLAPMLDFSTGKPQWVFVLSTAECGLDTKPNFNQRSYYRNVPQGTNNLIVKNPGY